MFHNVFIKMHDINVRVRTNNIEFVNYLHKHFKINITESRNPKIDVFFEWRESILSEPKPYIFNDLSKYCRIGRRNWMGANEMIWKEIGNIRNLQIKTTYEDITKLSAHYNLSISNYFIKRFYKQVIKAKSFRLFKKEIYEALTYYLVYYPVIYELERKGIFPIHASALTYNNIGILMPGLPGVGKSTLCLSLFSSSNAKFLSDNIVLYDKDRVYSCNEPIKLDSTSFDLLPDNGMKLFDLNFESYYGRAVYQVKKRDSIDTFIPEVLIMPCRGSSNELVDISSDEATKMSCHFNMIAGEINAYYTYSSVQDLCGLRDITGAQRNLAFDELTKKLRCYKLYLKPLSPMDEIIEIIKKVV